MESVQQEERLMQATRPLSTENIITVDGWEIRTAIKPDEIQVWYQRPQEGEGTYQPSPVLAVQIVQVSRDMVYTSRGHIPGLIGCLDVYIALRSLTPMSWQKSGTLRGKASLKKTGASSSRQLLGLTRVRS